MQSFIQAEDKRRKEEGTNPVSIEEKNDLVEHLQGTSARLCEQKLAELAPERTLPREKARAITEDAILIQFTVNKNLFKKMNQLKALWSHQNPEGKMEPFLEKLVDMALAKADPVQRKLKEPVSLPTRLWKRKSTKTLPHAKS